MNDRLFYAAHVYRKRMAFAIVCGHQEHFCRDFMDWLSRNWHVWTAFEVQACALWDRGTRHWSARTIVEYLRHETAVKQDVPGDEWKINNDQVPDLARLYMLMWPEREGFFERRVSPLSKRAA